MFAGFSAFMLSKMGKGRGNIGGLSTSYAHFGG